MRIAGAVALLILLAGCSVWHEAGGPFRGNGYALDLPTGWMYMMSSSSDRDLLVTRDGEPLQKIRVSVNDITKHKKDERKLVKKGMLPQEVAQVGIDVLSSDKSLGQFTVLHNEPASVSGNDGFRLVCTYRRSKLRYKSVIYGMLKGESLYTIAYSAPMRYYFDRDFGAFEDVVKTFKLNEKGPEPASKNTGTVPEPQLVL